MTLPASPNPGLHVRYEKAGLIFDALPIPWNADAVIIEAIVRAAGKPARSKGDFRLSLLDEKFGAELLIKDESAVRVLFRIPPPPQTCLAQVVWRDHQLGDVDVPILDAAQFLESFKVEFPTVHVGLAGGTAACETVVGSQPRTIHVVAKVTSPYVLSPLLDQDFHVELKFRADERVAGVPLMLAASQLRSRQAMVAAMLPRLRYLGAYRVEWRLGTTILATHKLRVISKKTFLRSLRISATRFIVHGEDDIKSVVRWLPERDGKPLLDGIKDITPCFFVASSEPGMAGIARLTVRAVMDDERETPAPIQEEVLVTDGPTPFIAGTLGVSFLPRVKHWFLETSQGPLGTLTLVPAPAADFTGEGGYAPIENFLWSPAADEELKDRLGKLLDGP